MTIDTTIKTSEMDFESYKSALKEYLRTQTRFRDYDFEGSNLSVLLDILSYNTFHNNFYNNMVLSEMFLDTAQMRSSVTSHAKSLNYMPRSRRSAAATIDVTLNVTDASPFVVLPSRTVFTTSGDRGVTLKFYTLENISILNNNGTYSSGPIEIYEGNLVSEKFFASLDKNYIYKIGNENIDTTTLKIFVEDSNGNVEEYAMANSLYGITTESKVFYLQLSNDTYEFYFGAGLFGKQPDPDDIITAEYIVSGGEVGNGACEFFAPTRIGGYPISRVMPLDVASGGSERETNASIKFNAAKAYQIQDRAVTETDYEIILKNNFPEIQALSVIGGEELNPPSYGNVFVYVDVKTMDGISENTKDKIRTFIKPRMPIGININVESPSFLYAYIETDVTFDQKISKKSSTDIKKLVLDGLKEYADDTLNVFGPKIYTSLAEGYINKLDAAIVSNSTSFRIYHEKKISIGTRNDFNINFGFQLSPIGDYAYRNVVKENANMSQLVNVGTKRMPTLFSSNFIYNGVGSYIRDNGTGVLQIVRQTSDEEVIVDKNIGSIDYENGSIRINRLIVDDITGSAIKFYATPAKRDFAIPKTTILSTRLEDVVVGATQL